MEKDINKYLTITRLKNGKVKITHDLENEINIYKLLYSLGFRRATLNNKKILFQKVENDLIPVSLYRIRSKFYELLKNFEFTNIPENVNYNDILDWNIDKQPIKQNRIFKQHLNIQLNEKDAHILRLKIDVDYKHRNEINEILSKLKKLNFGKSIDKKSSICTNAPLYYKKVDTNKFLIFSHYNAESNKNIDGFDCWIANYNNEKQIGTTIPSELKDIRLGFNLERDYELIKT